MLGFLKGGQDKESGRKGTDIEISTKSLYEYDYVKVFQLCSQGGNKP